jgi:hypothetical protein
MPFCFAFLVVEAEQQKSTLQSTLMVSAVWFCVGYYAVEYHLWERLAPRKIESRRTPLTTRRACMRRDRKAPCFDRLSGFFQRFSTTDPFLIVEGLLGLFQQPDKADP